MKLETKKSTANNGELVDLGTFDFNGRSAEQIAFEVGLDGVRISTDMWPRNDPATNHEGRGSGLHEWHHTKPTGHLMIPLSHGNYRR